ncbi:N-acetyltransferase [Desulfogranum marinum]|jgi:putative acetyltransferase|uniref:GNAT family N-acetyltransferase n=1 Tax=Desulfogranum marinum TaxID=453220 RepID=UPI0029C67AAC|nr:N-acetyltransferase [Desulfogranum marinum]
MKIRPVTTEDRPKVSALLQQAFPGSRYEKQLVENLHKKERTLHEWMCIIRNKVVAYIAYSNAYTEHRVCGLHLAPLAVNPEFQNRGIGSELLRFSLRRKEIKENTVFVVGAPHFYEKFGFTPCTNPRYPFTAGNEHFLSIRNTTDNTVTVGYEPEFTK